MSHNIAGMAPFVSMPRGRNHMYFQGPPGDPQHMQRGPCFHDDRADKHLVNCGMPLGGLVGEFKPPVVSMPDPPPAKKKRRSSSAASQPVQPPPSIQDLLPPPLTGYGDTIVASNPFDDTPPQMSLAMSHGHHSHMNHHHSHMSSMGGPPHPPMGSPMNSCPPMGSPMGVPMGSPMGSMGSGQMMNSGPMGSPMGPMGSPMNNMGGPQMNSAHMMGGPPMSGSPMGGPPMNGPMGGGSSMSNSPLGGAPMNGPMGSSSMSNSPMGGSAMNNGPMGGPPMNNGPMSCQSMNCSPMSVPPMNNNGPMGGSSMPGSPMNNMCSGSNLSSMGAMSPMNHHHHSPLSQPQHSMMGPAMNHMGMQPAGGPHGFPGPKPMPVSAGKVYPPDQPMVFNPQNPNAPPIYPCGMCHKEVHDNDQAILCESGCNFWFHRVCTGLTEAAYQLLTAEVYAEWVCDRCLSSKNIPLVKFKP